ncbi:MAG: sugar transferase [Chloroflexi bacterium HGW-Chloroflexi-1]|nr:MAG: sugar transferase [Chloroflexi bacterium HGW-Chloroflexi-1]
MHKRGPNYIAGLLLADLALTVLALHLATLVRLYLPYGVHLTPEYVSLPLVVYFMAAVVWLVVSAALAIYTSRRSQTEPDQIKAIISAVLLSNLSFAGLLYITYRDVPRLLYLYSLALQMSFLIGLRLAVYSWELLRYGRTRDTRVLIIGAGKVGQELAQRIDAQGHELTLVGFLDDDSARLGQVIVGCPVLGVNEQAPTIVAEHGIDEVFFALPMRAHRSLESLVSALQAMPVRVRVVPDFFDLAFFRATIEDFGGIPLIGLRDPAIAGVNRLIKRLLDLAVAALSLTLAAPLMLLIGLAIKLDSPGPVFFRQQRVGENGKLFTIFKFRSMKADAEACQQEAITVGEEDQVLHKRPDDPRVTRVGRILRHSSLDELPQLLNVLKGDMSLVGPRPELPWLVDHYETWQRKRFAVPPGITGWWQINGRSDRPMHLHTDDDLYYIQHYSPLMDLQILLRTIGAVLKGRGAY